MNRYGLTEERFNQMMTNCNNDTEEIQSIINNWGVENCNKGYTIFDYNGTGLLEIEAIGDVGAFEDSEATEQAISDGIKIIPVEQLPMNMPEDMCFYGWIDTLENRKAIKKYCEEV